MDKQLLDIILCPLCGNGLELVDATITTVAYPGRARDEVESGALTCPCGRQYPITDFVLSFAQLSPPALRQEAAYWDRYYLWLLEQGSFGFFDLHLGQAPYITAGVPEPFPEADVLDRYDIHHQLAEHPLLRKGHTLLDVGVGLGWTSLYFARAGYEVTAFEPSLGPVKAAKRHAMQQGVFVEYVCAALGAVAFRPDSFDNVSAFHSLHHVPDLEKELRKVRSWLRAEGALAIDEHVGNSRLAAALSAELHAWAEAEVFPRYRTLSPEALAGLPQEPHSAFEDSSVSKVVPLVSALFEVRLARPRHVFLDHYPLLFYLHANKDPTAFRHALAIANQMQELVRRVDPDGADYITIVAANTRAEQQPIDTSEDAQDEHDALASEPSPDFPDAVGRIQELEEQLALQGIWARGLEREVTRKNDEIARMKTLIDRLQKGRVMRLLRLLRK